MWNLKNWYKGTNELIYKKEIESQIQKNYGYDGGKRKRGKLVDCD